MDLLSDKHNRTRPPASTQTIGCSQSKRGMQWLRRRTARAISLLFLILLTASLLGSCSRSKGETKKATDLEPASHQTADSLDRDNSPSEIATETEIGATKAAANNDLSGGASPAERKISYHYNIVLKADQPTQVMASIEEQVQKAGGYVQSSSVGGDIAKRVHMTVKIPTGKADGFVNGLKDLGTIVETDKSSDDVTSQYYDVEARLNNAKKQEKKLLEIMDKAESIEDILQVQEQIDQVQERIEQLTSEMKYMTNITDLAEVSITIRPAAQIEAGGTGVELISGSDFVNGLKNGLRDSLTGLGNFIAMLVIGISYAIIPLLLIGLIVFVVLRIHRAYRKKHPKQKKVPAPRVVPMGYGPVFYGPPVGGPVAGPPVSTPPVGGPVVGPAAATQQGTDPAAPSVADPEAAPSAETKKEPGPNNEAKAQE